MAIFSLFVPGMSQWIQGRITAAMFHLLVCIALWTVGAGAIMHIFSCYDAFCYVGKKEKTRSTLIDGAYIRHQTYDKGPYQPSRGYGRSPYRMDRGYGRSPYSRR